MVVTNTHIMTKALTLYELNNLVAGVISADLPDEYWVEAEVAEVREVKGHCYMELVQKDPCSNTPVARASAKCWRTTWTLVRSGFERVAGQRLHPGMKVMLRVYADFHEAYGFAWIVTDVNPEYTMGDLARRRKEIVETLKSEGVFGLQKELSIPMFAQRVAVVSSDGAAGYGDFCKHLAGNDCGFKFIVRLFPAVMQGEAVEHSVIAALDGIYACADDFDVVVIIRGGGATSDLSGFDTLALAENVANFPLPIVTGIGHERDESVLDLVSCVSVKTPTAAAALLVDNLRMVAARLERAAQSVSRCAVRRMDGERLRLERLSASMSSLFAVVRTRQDARLDRMSSLVSSMVARRLTDARSALEHADRRCAVSVDRMLTSERHRLAMLAQRTAALDPVRLLSRGYSITTFAGHVVRDASALKDGDVVETRVANGTLRSVVKKKP